MLIIACSFPTTQRLHSFKFTLVNKSYLPHSESFCPLLRTPFSNFVCMCTQGLVPRPKTTVISLEARLEHRRNGKLLAQYAWLARSFPPAALGSKAYEHHIGKVLPTCSYTKNSLLTALVSCKAGQLSVCAAAGQLS